MSKGFIGLKAFEIGELLAHEIFTVTQTFPKEERYSLTDQIRRSSRSVCSNIAEGYAKRRYPKHFVAKLTDAKGENNETLVWLRFARRSGYIDNSIFIRLEEKTQEVSRLISFMIANPTKFYNALRD